ncbi:DUF1376 domain-containing protein [Acinetobacter baumannii]|nr:DUF1376 domain-containing protein [Acinetobacter baumannii]MDO7434564.1 DUF1376 domain-containing protein [Acinetobacter baumannii]
MNYYQHHIGDFNNATRHLSLIERAIYRDLLDMYYDTEKAIDASSIDRLARRLQCTTEEQKEALKYVLDEFFILEEGVYRNNRCEREIAAWKKRGWFPSLVKGLRPKIDEWKETRVRIFKRDNFTCFYCGQVGGPLECDHYIPISKGGKNEDSNLVTACKKCNRAKSNKNPEDFIKESRNV